ncbi:MAG: biotin/lipoyl-containing protein [Elusimicrobiota bacterium]|nr:biotin/lipoyl-containing protein [Elusimicrobiota bacterium]
MNEDLRAVSDWMKTTDLVEVVWRKGAKGFALCGPDAPSTNLQAPPLPASRFLPVPSEGVGVFQWNEPGKARLCEEGAAVPEGAVLGIVTTGSGKAKPVKAPAAGRVVKVFVDAGQAVEYGQPLFLVEPA